MVVVGVVVVWLVGLLVDWFGFGLVWFGVVFVFVLFDRGVGG